MRAPSARRTGRRALPVDESTVGGRLRALRETSSRSQDEAAEHLLVTRTQVSKYERGAHEPPDHVVERAAQFYGVTPAFIRYGDTRSQMAPVIGIVGAGAQVEAVETGRSRYVEIPAGWDDAVALEVQGDSCWPVYEEGDFIVVRGEQRLQPEEVVGRMCVVETADGLGLVKRVRRGSEAGLFTLESPNARPLEDVTLHSARPVRLHLPR